MLSADFDPSGRLLATAGEDDHVLLWDVEAQRLLARLVHHKGSVRAVRFSTTKARTLAAGSLPLSANTARAVADIGSALALLGYTDLPFPEISAAISTTAAPRDCR